MSLIYDALKRAEDDNKRTTGTLRAGERRTLLGKRRQQWMWALVAVLGVNAVVVTTLVVTLGSRSSGSRAPDTDAPVAATPVPAPPPTPTRAVPVEPPVVARPVPLPAPPRVARVEPAPAVKATKAPVAPAPRAAPTPPAEPPRVATRPREEPVAPPRKSEVRAEPESSRRPPITGEKLPAAPESESSAGARPLPPPAITLQVIVYSDVPAQRMVFIEGRRLAEGDAIDAETTLERINQDGIVIRRRGVRYVVLSNRD